MAEVDLATAMRSCLAMLAMVLALPVAVAGDFSSAAAQEAKAEGIQDVKMAVADVASVTKKGNSLTVTFTGQYPKIGPQMVNALNFTWRGDAQKALLDIPADTKHVRIYWGCMSGDFCIAFALQKVH